MNTEKYENDKKEILNLCSKHLDLEEENHEFYMDKIVIMQHTDDSVGFSGLVAFMVFGAIQYKAIFEKYGKDSWELTETIFDQEYTDYRIYKGEK
tara:strand:+ start:320 stop:604 length:285 start_codon:yes stop_codon:yes gene_type:complete